MLRTKIRRYLKHGTLRQLSVFEAVARLGSFTRAAEELHMAQPTVSVQIRKLSESMGLPLFEHAGRKIRLTAAGAALEDACHELFATLARLENRAGELRDQRAAHSAGRETAGGRL